MAEPIYVVTVFNVYSKGVRNDTHNNDQRTWGWFPTMWEAEAALRGEGNDNFFESGTYQYAVIEETPPGVNFSARRPCWWFSVEYRLKASSAFDRYRVTTLEEPPPFARGTSNFGFG